MGMRAGVRGLLLGFPPGASGASAPADTTAPTVEITSAAAATVYEAFSATITFSEAVVGFAVGDITPGNCTLDNFADSGDATTFTVTVTPTAAGAVTLDIAAGVCTGAAGNDNEAATQFTRTYFTPSQVSGLTLWLKFNDNTTLKQASNGTGDVTDDGNPIGFADDQSASDKNATQATSVARPAWKTNIQNGLAVARFDGNDFLATASGQFVNGTTGVWTAFAVAKPTDSTGVESLLDSDDYQVPANRVAQFLRFNAANAETICFNTARDAGTDTCASAHGAVWVILAAVRSATGVEIFQNGTGNGEAARSGTPATAENWVMIGATNLDGPSQKFAGDMGEVLIYNAALSAASRQSVEAYLSAKWGVALD